jgi:hypothetical protein
MRRVVRPSLSSGPTKRTTPVYAVRVGVAYRPEMGASRRESRNWRQVANLPHVQATQGLVFQMVTVPSQSLEARLAPSGLKVTRAPKP